MSLIVEDGTGLEDAESYVSVADADAYHSAFGNTDWAALTTPLKEQALRKATQYLDARYTFRGDKTNIVQALSFPRFAGYGYYNEETIALQWRPRPLYQACCILALTASAEDLFVDGLDQAVKREQVGPLEVEYFQSSNRGQKNYVEVTSILKTLLRGGGLSGVSIERVS